MASNDNFLLEFENETDVSIRVGRKIETTTDASTVLKEFGHMRVVEMQ